MSDIGKIVDLINELWDLVEKNKARILVERNMSEVHLPNTRIFMEFFKHFDIKEFNNEKFLYEASVEIEGVRFCTLLTQAEYEIFVLNKEVG